PEALALRLAEALLKIRHDARERHRPRLAHAAQLEREEPFAGAVEERLARLFGQVPPWLLGVEGELLRELLEYRVVLDYQVLAADPPGLDRAPADGLLRVRDDEFRDRAQPAPEAAA